MPCLLFTQTRAKCFGGKVSVELIYKLTLKVSKESLLANIFEKSRIYRGESKVNYHKDQMTFRCIAKLETRQTDSKN